MDGDNEDMFSDIDSDQGYEQMRSSEGEDESDDSEGLLGDDGFEHEHTAGRRGANDDDDFAYKVLTPEDIVKDMCEIITEISNIVRLHSTTTRMLLNHMKWDKGKLLETYYTNADDLFAKAHIASPLNKVEVKPGAAALPSSSSVAATRPKAPVIYNCGQNEECLICFMDCPAFRLTGLACGHRFCKACWAEYLTIKIMTEGMGQTISCAAHNCDVLVDDQRVMELVHDKKVKQRYQQLITNSFVECNMLMRWCPGPDCPNAVRASQPECKPVTCICGLTFCFLCSNEWHEPISCRLLKKWLKKCSDDSETSNWISANTKECPKCHVTIEKNGGCNHITCKNTACKEEFCWICLGPWAPHGSSWYNCNRFDDSAAVQARDAQALSRANLERYLFYYNRYANHLQSMRFEHKLYSQVKSKMEEIQQQNMSWIEVQFLKKAVDVLCQCRRTLMYTYAFSYYLKPTNEVHIFEDNQKDLEHSTELLSEYLERDINKDNVADMKQKVQDKYRYCDNRRVILLEHCKEGSEQDKWKYND